MTAKEFFDEHLSGEPLCEDAVIEAMIKFANQNKEGVKYTFETYDYEEAQTLFNANKNAYIVFELKHNFWRRWKHSDKDITLEELQDAISDLVYDED